MKRTLDVSIPLKDFSGEPLTEDGKPVTLKGALLTYVRCAHNMGLAQSQESILYAVGMRIGLADAEVSLSPEQYDALKLIVDRNRITLNGQELHVMNIVT